MKKLSIFKYLKSFLVVFLTLGITLLPASAEYFDYSQYDFSDEAQMKFDNQNTFNPTSTNNDYSIEKNKKKNKNQQIENTELYTPEQNTTNQIEDNIPNNDLNNNTNVNTQYNNNSKYNNNNNTNTYHLDRIDGENEKPLQGSVEYIPSGTSFDVVFESGISSGSLDKNDRLTCTLPEDFSYNGQVIAPAGSMVSGTVSDARSAGYAYGAGSMAINFDEIQPTTGNPIKISTETIVVTAKSTRAKNMSRDVLVGVGVGIVGGLLSALLTGGGGEEFVRAIAIGGGIGGAAGGIHGATQRGDDVKIPDGTRIKLKLTQPINISPQSY